MSDIDWRAVNFVVRGARMKLTPDERKMVLRRIKLFKGRDTSYIPPGYLTLDMVAHRLGIHERHVWRIADELPNATERACPICGSLMWVYDGTGLVEPHPDSLVNECPLSLHVLADLDHLDMVMIRVQWLRSWVAAGDLHGVWAYLAELPDTDRQELTMAALYTEELES